MSLISIIMPVYNVENYLDDAIESILSQTYKDFELIIINDGSTDNSQKVIKKYRDRRIRCFVNKTNKGVAVSLNIGLQKVRGSYIARMDSDDISVNNRLSLQYKFLTNNPDIALIGSAIILIDNQGKEKGKKAYPLSSKEIKKSIMKYNPFAHPTIVFRREILKSIGLYNETYDGAEDYEFLLRVVSKYKAANLKQTLLKHRDRSGRTFITDMKKAEWQALRARTHALLDYGYPWHESIYLAKPFMSYFVPASIKRLAVT